MLSLLSPVRLFATPGTVARQTPLSMDILQARRLEWDAMPSSRGFSPPKDRTCVSLAGGFFTTSFPGGSDGKASACNAGDTGSIPGPGRSPGEGYGNPLQDACLENAMDRGAWLATVPGVAKSRTGLSDFTFFSPGKPKRVVISI